MDIKNYYAKPDKTIKEHSDQLLNALQELYILKYISSDSLLDLIRIACIYHDYGKVNPQFQIRVKSKKQKFNPLTEVSHNVLSLYFLPKNIFEDESDYYRVAHSILNHHDYCNTIELLQDEEKQVLIKILLDEFKDEIEKIGPKGIRKINQVIKEEDMNAIIIKGFLHKCDYSASAGMKVEYPNDFLYDKMKNLYNWNILQLFCKENTDKNIIAVAQTGMGKTEGGLLWIGDNKGFFILPIRTAINAIYDRIEKDILKGEHIEERLALLHSGALEYYSDNIDCKEMDLVDYFERGKKLSMPLTICTMDQLFDFVYKYNGYEMKLVTLSYSKIVLDEIQMYSPDLLAYLICGIKKIRKFGGKIAVLTATLPPFVRDEIVEALEGDVEEEIFANKQIRHNLEVVSQRLCSKIIIEKYKENEENERSNKILVVCNTIKKAQEVCLELRKAFENQNVNLNLLHARFLKEDRAEKEKSILEFGKTYTEEGDIDIQSGIWISTSIVEASLDIDFDYLFTELQDLNSLFQRLGRCNRKGKKSTDEPNCYVFTVIDVTKNMDQEIYNISKEAIETVDGIISEEEKVELINKNFTTEKMRRSEYYKEYRKIKYSIENIAPYELKRSEINLRNIQSVFIMPSPIYEERQEEINDCLERLEIEEDKIEKSRLREYIRSLTVSIPLYMKKNVNIHTEIVLNRFEKIPVMECRYDKEIGFKEIDNSDYIRDTKFL